MPLSKLTNFSLYIGLWYAHIYFFKSSWGGKLESFCFSIYLTRIGIPRWWVWEWNREVSKWCRSSADLSDELLGKREQIETKKTQALDQPSSGQLYGYNHTANQFTSVYPCYRFPKLAIIFPYKWFLFLQSWPIQSIFHAVVPCYLSKIHIIPLVACLKSSMSLRCSEENV